MASPWSPIIFLKLFHRPRKCLGYLSPFEVLFQTPLHLT